MFLPSLRQPSPPRAAAAPIRPCSITRRWERLGGVSLEDIDGLLGDDPPAVGDFIDEVHRRARDLHTVVERRAVDAKPIEPRAAKRRDQRRMDVQDPLRILCDERRGQMVINPASTIRSISWARRTPSSSHSTPPASARRAGRPPPPPLRGGARSSANASGLLGHDQRDLRRGHLPTRRGVENGLQVGAAAGHEHRNPRGHTTSTRPSPATTEPMTDASSPASRRDCARPRPRPRWRRSGTCNAHVERVEHVPLRNAACPRDHVKDRRRLNAAALDARVVPSGSARGMFS